MIISFHQGCYISALWAHGNGDGVREVVAALQHRRARRRALRDSLRREAAMGAP